MTTAVDTNVFFELLGANEERRLATRAELDDLAIEDMIIISELVYAELAGRFPDRDELNSFLTDAQVSVVETGLETLFTAGHAWVAYARRRPIALACATCGTETVAQCSKCESVLSLRQRLLPDFCIGAHALAHADRLLTRDKGYYGTYFPDLELV